MDALVVRVQDVVGSSFALSGELGDRVYDLVRESMCAGRGTVLDFDGVDGVTMVFLSSAIGALYGEFDLEQMRALLRIENANSAIEGLIEVAVRGAIRYAADPEAAEARYRALVLDD